MNNKMWADKTVEEKTEQINGNEYLEIEIDGVICHILSWNIDSNNKLQIDWIADGFNAMTEDRQQEIGKYVEEVCMEIIFNKNVRT